MPYAAVNGQHLYYEESGTGSPALVFSHGLLMDQTMFAPQIEALKHHYRCISWDERAHGRTASSDNCEPFSYYDSADDLAALLHHLGIEQAILVGMSQGGYLSLRAALKHPAIVRALVLIDTQAGPEDPAKMPGYAVMIADYASNGLSDESAAILEHVILGDGWSGASAWKEKWAGWKPHNLLQSFTTLGTRDDIRDQLGRIDVPVLVIHGDSDAAIEPERAKAMTDALPHARMELIVGGGHASNLTHPDQVNPLIEAFVAQLA